MSFEKPPLSSNEKFGFIARATWHFWVNLRIQPFFGREKSDGDDNQSGLAGLRFGSCLTQAG